MKQQIQVDHGYNNHPVGSIGKTVRKEIPMARFKYYRYNLTTDNAEKLPMRSFIRIENGNTAVYERPLTDAELKKFKLEDAGNGKISNLVKLRMAKGLTQEELGNIVECGRTAIQNYELKGTGNCPLKYAVKLAKALDCSITDLIDF